jgi:hypothetical protein
MNQEHLLNSFSPENVSYDLRDEVVRYTIPDNFSRMKNQCINLPVVMCIVKNKLDTDSYNMYEIHKFHTEYSGETVSVDLLECEIL